jgi:hypothetical protein
MHTSPHLIQSFKFNNLSSLFEASNSTFSIQDNITIDNTLKEIDCLVNYLLTFKKVSDVKLSKALDTEFRKLKYCVLNKVHCDQTLYKLLEVIIDDANRIISDYFKTVEESTEIDSAINADSITKDRVAELHNNGYCEFKIETNDLFVSESKKLLEYAREMFIHKNDWRGLFCNDNERFGIFRYCSKFLEKNNILHLVSAYQGYESEIAWCGWDYNHSRQNWFKKNQANPSTHPTNYYHLDSGFDKSKIIFYLTDVGVNDGPFKYVKGSNMLARSLVKFALHLSLDSNVNKHLYGENKLEKNIFIDDIDVLRSFPKSFVGSTHFGDYLDRDSILTQYLIQNTVDFTRKRGSAILFNGNLGVHAGGNPISGDRLIVQFGFQNKRSKVSRIKKLFKKHF